jgi:anti-sigma B factor antagonist
MEIKADIKKENGVVVLSIKDKEISHNNSASLKEKIFLEIADGNSKIVLDLKKVQELDSSGLGALLFGKRQANNAGGNIVLVSISPAVQSLLRIAQLTRVFDTFETVKDAIKFYGK